MKVIANIGSERVLVEMTKAEIGRMHGVEGYYSTDTSRAWLEVGYEFDIARTFDVAKDLKNLDRSRIKQILSQLDTTTKQVIEIQEQVQALTLFNTLSQE